MRFARVLAGLGALFRLFSFSVLIPLFASLWWDPRTDVFVLFGDVTVPTTTIVFTLTFLLIFLVGWLLSSISAVELEELREREGFAIVGFAWLLLAALGGLPFLLTNTTRKPLVAYFETMSGLTTTGSTALPLDTFESILPSVHVWRATLQFVGGLGIIVLAVAVLARMTDAGQRLMSAESPGSQVTRLKPKITQTAAALWNVYILFTLVLFAILWPALHFTGRQLPWKEAALDAMIVSFTTMSTGGFSNHANSIAYFQSPTVTWIVVGFMILAGVNFNLYWHAFHGRERRLFKDAELRFFLTVFLAAFVAVSLILIYNGRSVGQGIEDAAFQTASFLTSTGATSTDHNAFPDAARLVLLLLMFNGACVGSTTGGLKSIRILIMLRLTRVELQRLLHPHAVATLKVEGRIVPDDTLRRIVVFFFAFVSLVLAGSFFYAFIGFDFVSAIATATAMVCNTGPTFGRAAYAFSDVPDVGKVVGILLMWMGRLEIFTALVLFFPRTYRE
jgi:trk system potassium uptake protein